MFKVKNVTGSSVSILLKSGGFILGPGKEVDLDGECDREWLRENQDIKKFIQHGILVVLNADVVEKQIVKPVENVEPREEPVILDYSDNLKSADSLLEEDNTDDEDYFAALVTELEEDRKDSGIRDDVFKFELKEEPKEEPKDERKEDEAKLKEKPKPKRTYKKRKTSKKTTRKSKNKKSEE